MGVGKYREQTCIYNNNKKLVSYISGHRWDFVNYHSMGRCQETVCDKSYTKLYVFSSYTSILL